MRYGTRVLREMPRLLPLGIISTTFLAGTCWSFMTYPKEARSRLWRLKPATVEFIPPKYQCGIIRMSLFQRILPI